MTVSAVTDKQLENYPGARFQHFTDMLKFKDFAAEGKSPANRVMALGLNDRSSEPKNFQLIKKRF